MKKIVEKESKLIDFLHVWYPDSSKRTIKQWITNGRIVSENIVLKKTDILLKKDQLIEIRSEEKTLKNNIKIIYIDPHIIVIDKPSGLLSVPKEHSMEKNALDEMRFHLKEDKIYPVHRIDQKTSGTLVFARGKPIAKTLGKLFFSHEIDRYYIALVHGIMDEDKGQWKSYLKEMENFSVQSVSENEGKLAITDYEVMKRNKKSTLIKLKLYTGKKHQIRVHCLEAGHPIIGDKRYKPIDTPIRRLMLHAMHLGFKHPVTGKKMTFISPIPKMFQGEIPVSLSKFTRI